MPAHILKSSFNAGEISPLMDSRVDTEKYPFSCRRLENFIPKIYGGAFRRPGMVYLGAVGDGASAVMLLSFNFSATVRYILELGDEYCRIWQSDGTKLTDTGGTVELTTPYTAAELFDLKHVQLNNVAFFTHPDHAPQRLTRYYDDTEASYQFTWDAMPIDYPCFRDTHTGTTTATPSVTTGTGTLSFSVDIFDEVGDKTLYEGSKILITQRRETSYISHPLTTTATSSEITVLGTFSVNTYGTWDGVLVIQQQDDNGDWHGIRTFKSSSDRNIELDTYQDEAKPIRLDYTAVSAGTGSPRAVIEADDSRHSATVTIDEINYVSDLPVVDITVNEDLVSTDATTEWALEAWGDYCGYPRAIVFHELRLWFGGTELEPNTFWGSGTDDFFNYRRGVFDSDSVAFTLAAQEGSAIQSLLSHEALVIFTQAEEWTATTTDRTAITPSNIFVRRQSRYGSAYKQSMLINNNIIFLQRGARKLREFSYTARESGGISEDLSMLSEHLVRVGVKQIAHQQQPDPVIWMVTTTGELLSMTYESNQNVIGWSTHPTDGTVESVAVIYGDTDSSDEVWLVANRTGGRYVERIDPDASTNLESETAADFIYLDSAVRYSGAATTSITGLSHLEGEEVTIVADDYLVASKTVSSGAITLDKEATEVCVGLPYTSFLQPSKVDLPLDDGTSQGRKFIAKQITLNLWKSRGLEYADHPDSTFFEVDASALYTGEISLNNRGSHRTSVDVAVRQTLPFPAAVLGMVIECDVMG